MTPRPEELASIVRGMVEREAEAWVRELLPDSPQSPVTIGSTYPADLWGSRDCADGSTLCYDVALSLWQQGYPSIRRIRVIGRVSNLGIYRSYITNFTRTAYLWFADAGRREENGMSVIDLDGGVPMQPDSHQMVLG